MELHVLKVLDQDGSVVAEAPFIVHDAEAAERIIRGCWPSGWTVTGMTLLGLLDGARNPQIDAMTAVMLHAAPAEAADVQMLPPLPAAALHVTADEPEELAAEGARP